MERQRSIWSLLLTPLFITAALSGCQRGQMGSGSTLGTADEGSAEKPVSAGSTQLPDDRPVDAETLLHDGEPPFNPWESLEVIRTRLQHELLASGYSEALVQRLAASLADSKREPDFQRTPQANSVDPDATSTCPAFFAHLYASLTESILTAVPETLNDAQSLLAMGLAQKTLLASYEQMHDEHPFACEMSLEPFVQGHLKWKQALRAKPDANTPGGARPASATASPVVPPYQTCLSLFGQIFQTTCG